MRELQIEQFCRENEDWRLLEFLEEVKVEGEYGYFFFFLKKKNKRLKISHWI